MADRSNLPEGAPPPAPRPFRLRAINASAMFLLLFGGIWGLVGSIITVVFTMLGGPPWDDTILDRRSVVAMATPVSITQASGEVNGRPIYRIVYTFADGRGQAQSTTSTTDGELVLAASTRTPIAIEYDPQRPRRARVQGQRASVFGLFVLFPVGFAVVGGALLLLGLWRVARLRAIYVRGRAAPATVTGVSRSPMRVNGLPVMRVDYSFAASVGGAQTIGRTTTRRPPAIGDRIWILYDPDDPRRSVAAV